MVWDVLTWWLSCSLSTYTNEIGFVPIVPKFVIWIVSHDFTIISAPTIQILCKIAASQDQVGLPLKIEKPVKAAILIKHWFWVCSVTVYLKKRVSDLKNLRLKVGLCCAEVACLWLSCSFICCAQPAMDAGCKSPSAPVAIGCEL